MTDDGVVRRDPWGVPELWAPDAVALSRLQGRVVALDRAWQLECLRWRSEGRSAEHLGAVGLEWDLFARRVRLHDTARRCFDALDPETAEWVAAHADGVGEGLVAAAAATPEFAAAGVEPDPWQPWTPVAVLLTQHVLFGSLSHKLWRDRVRRHAPDAWSLLGAGAAGTDGSGGSNAWAVTGDRTASGAPVVAGDPHRNVELPGTYVQVRLACPEFDVVGLAFPGVPGVPHFGHAGSVAWGITNAMADCHDLYEEQLRRSADGVEQLTPRGWEPADAHMEQVVVRGAAPVPVEVVETARGPVVVGGPDTTRALSVRMVPRVESDCGLATSLALLRSRSAGDVREAWRRWVEPVNAVVTADRDGRVLEFTAGLVPLRDPALRDGPVAAEDPAHDWQGYADHGESVVAGATVHANHATDLTRPHSDHFAPADRASRIIELLDGRRDLVVEDHHAIHLDTRSLAAGRLLPRLDALDPLSPTAQQLRDRLRTWDRRMDARSTEAGAYAAWRTAVVRRLAAAGWLDGLAAVDDLPPLFAPWLSVPQRLTTALERVLADPPAGVDVDEVLRAALEEVAAEPEQEWGARHVLAPLRTGPPGEQPPTPVSVSGDRDCVLATTPVTEADDASTLAPAARYVWDLADRAASRWVGPPGTAGSPGTPHSLDQQPLWVGGGLLPVPDDPLAPA